MVAPELTADDPVVTPFATAPPDVVYISGFEQGVLVAPSLGTITGAGFSVTATNPRSGNYCLHLVAPANTAETIQYSQFPSWPNVRARVGIKVSARPAAGSAVLFAVINSSAGTLAQVTVSSAGVLSLKCGSGTVQAGPTIDTTSWHYVELQFTGVASATCDWKVDGVAQTRATGTITVGGNTGFLLGQAGTTGPAFTCDYDDIIVGPWTVAATDWYGDGYILAQQPGSDGTHATVADFSPGDAGTLYSGTVTNAWTQVVKTTPWSTTRSTTSCLGMRVVNTNAYLEILPAPTTVSGASANAVQPWISYSSSGTGSNAAAVTAYNSALGTTGSLQGTVGGALAAFNVTTNTIKCSSVPILKPAAGWTPAEVNAARIRFGGGTSSDIAPVPTLQALMFEVDWPVVVGGPQAITPTAGATAQATCSIGVPNLTGLFCTGFEHGALSANGGGLFASITGTPTIVSAAARNGGFGFRSATTTATTASARLNQWTGPSKGVLRVAIRLSSLPAATNAAQLLFLATANSVFLTVSIADTGQLTLVFGGGSAVTGPTITTGGWHLLEIQFDCSGATFTADWKVDGVAQTRTTIASAASTITVIAIGTENAGTSTSGVTVDFDDLIFGSWSYGVTDWFGDGQVLAQLPGSDGAHNIVADFSPGDAGTAYSGTVTTAWTMVSDAPGTGGWTTTRSTTDSLGMRVANTAAYMEIAPVATPVSGQSANAVRALLSYSSPTTLSNAAACDVRNSAGVVTALNGTTGGTLAGFNVTANTFAGGLVTKPAAGWTAAEVNGVRFRFGGGTSSDISPVPTVQAMMLEVDWPQPMQTLTPIFLTGFEHGVGGLSSGTAGSPLILNAAARSGGLGLRVTNPGPSTSTYIYWDPPTNFTPKAVVRFAVKVSSRPASGSVNIAWVYPNVGGNGVGVWVHSDGTLGVAEYTTQVGEVTGPAIDTTSWHVIELQLDCTTATWTIDWKVDGAAQSRLTLLSHSVAAWYEIGLGCGAGGAAFTCDYDDLIVGSWIMTATDWWGNGRILPQLAGSDGTHNTVADFSPGDAGTAYSGTVTTAWTLVADGPGTGGWSSTRSTTDNIAMRIANTTAYMEIAPAAATVSGVSANAVQAIMSFSSPTTGGNAAGCDARNSGGTVTPLQGATGGVLADYSVTNNNWSTGIVAKPAAGWTPAEVNAVRIRFGGGTSSDVVPIPTVQAMMLEVDWPPAALVSLLPQLHHRRPAAIPARRDTRPSRAHF